MYECQLEWNPYVIKPSSPKQDQMVYMILMASWVKPSPVFDYGLIC